MSKQILLDCRLFAGGVDLSGASNKAELEAEREIKDVTTFASGGWTEHLAGLGSASVSAEGFWEAGDPSKVDNVMWANLGGIGPWTICPSAADVGALAYVMNGVQGDYLALGTVGDVAPYKASVSSTWPLARGQIVHPPGTARTASGVGPDVELGSLGAGESLFAALHVLSISGSTTPTLTVSVESDVDSGFASPVVIATFDPVVELGAQIARVASPITDEFYRVSYDISGTDPSFLFLVALGVA